jgi:hypothetical protein
MPARKMHVELFDSDGNRYSISFEGQVTRDKALRLLDLVELLGGVPSGGSNPAVNTHTLGNGVTKFDKVRMVIQKYFPIVWFSSRELQSVYEQELKEPIALSTVATYLARMVGKGIILKTGTSNNLKYKTAAGISEAIVKQSIM